MTFSTSPDQIQSLYLDPNFPILTQLGLTGLSLQVDFDNGTSQTFGSSYFTLGSDGESFNGGIIPIGGTNPKPKDATLTGTFSTTSINVNGVGPVTINSSFSVTFSDSPNLVDGDFGLITATTGTAASVPEPGAWTLLATCLLGVAITRPSVRRVLVRKQNVLPLALLACCLAAVQSASASVPTVNLTTWTTPDNGVAGVDSVNVVGSGFPSGTITPANIQVTFATSCGGAVSATASANSIKTVLGATKRVNVTIPGGLLTGTYFVQISDLSAGDSDFASSNCTEVNVTHTNPALSACIPTSSLGVLVPTGAAPQKVTAYVPNGSWCCSSGTGVQAVDIENGSGKTSISTRYYVNSCSSNPATGQTVCVGNNTDVYLISGTALTNTLTSGATHSANFSGGSCQNCGVAINALTNKAVIAGGFGASDGVQMLDLNTNTFLPPFGMSHTVSEDISIDPTRNLILSPGEDYDYTILQIQSDGVTLKEFSLPNYPIYNDSAAEDCATGIALSGSEIADQLWIEDLTQAVFTPGTPYGTYTAAGAVFNWTTNYYFSAAFSGLSVAPGSSHLGVVTGEFGGNSFGVYQLPATSGSGTPTLVDYASALIPNSALCGTWSAGYDPHTVTAYTSPNDGKAYALFANYNASCLVRIDLAAVLAAPRGGSGLAAHDVSAANFPAGAATFYLTH